MTQEHLGIAVALEVPFFIMVTKVDVTPRPKLQATLDSLQRLLTSVGANKVKPLLKVVKKNSFGKFCIRL